MLAVEALNQYYGGSHILRDLSFEVPSGKVTTLLGRNGVGKTTLMRTLMGLVPARTGRIVFENQDLARAKPYERARAGIGYVPQGREIFPRLTVGENLLMSARSIPERIFQMFPVLKGMLGRRGGDLSGGQQQQLAIGRALAMRPKLLILDEPTEGIQPSIIKDIAKVLREIRKLRQITIIVSEQVLSFVLEACDRLMVMESGRIVHEASRENVDASRVKQLLAV